MAVMTCLTIVAALSVLAPLLALLRRMVLAAGPAAGGAPDWERVAASLATTLGLGVAGAVAATVCAIPLAVLATRAPSRLSEALQVAVFLGHGLPGIVVGLSLVSFTLAVIPVAYQSLAALVFAYVVMFLPKALAGSRSALSGVSPGLQPVAQTLGRSRSSAFWTVTVRLASPGIAAGALLVMVTVMKELPATLMLRPTGMNTLATELWDRTAVARYGAATPYAIALVLVAAIPAWLLADRPRRDPEKIEPPAQSSPERIP